MRPLLLLLLMFVTGCGASAQRAQSMDDHSLIMAHHQHIDFWDRADMVLVDEIVARGGLSEEAREEYAHGARVHRWRPETVWGRPNHGMLYSYDKMGWTYEDVLTKWGMSSSGQTVVSYSQYGSVRGRKLGGGTIVTRGTPTVRVRR